MKSGSSVRNVSDRSIDRGSRLAHLGLGLLCTLAVCMWFIAPAAQAAPANDNFADAQTLVAGESGSGNLTGATLEPGEPNQYEFQNNLLQVTGSVWYEWTPSEDAVASFDPGPLGAVLVFTGSQLDSLKPVANGLFSPVSFAAKAGTTYRIAVMVLSAIPGDAFDFNLSTEPPPIAENDAFADAELLEGTGSRAGIETVWATREAGEPDHGGTGTGGSVWFEWTPGTQRPQILRLDDCDPTKTVIAVYSGSELEELEPAANGTCSVRFDAEPATPYRIAVETQRSPEPLTLNFFSSPANDDLENAEVLSGTTVEVEGNLAGSTLQSGEWTGTTPIGVTGSVWYEWTAPMDGPVSVGVSSGAAFALVFAFKDTGFGEQDLVTGDGFGGATFNAIEGETYSISLLTGSGPFAVTGFQLSLSQAPGQAPGNDDFEAAFSLDAEGGTYTGGNTLWATRESGEPDHDGAGGDSSVWYSWSPTEPGLKRIELEICAESKVNSLAVYTGSDIEALSPVASGQCAVVFEASGEATYRIAIETKLSQYPRQFNLRYSSFGPPSNDNLADAVPISGSNLTVDGTLADATREPGESAIWGVSQIQSVWYEWTAPRSGPATIRTNLGTGLIASTGASFGSMEVLATALSGQPLAFDATAGETYKIGVGTWPEWGPTAEFTITLTQGPVSLEAPVLISTTGHWYSTYVGWQLTCSPGTWSGAPNQVHVTWARDGVPFENLAANGKTTKRTYVPQPSDAGSKIECFETGQNRQGSGTSASSNPVTVIDVVPMADVAPQLTTSNATGNQIVDEWTVGWQLRGVPGSYSNPTGNPWIGIQRGFAQAADPLSDSVLFPAPGNRVQYVTQASDLGKEVVFVEIATNIFGSTSAFSNQTLIVE